MLRRVAVIRTRRYRESSAPIIRETRIGELETLATVACCEEILDTAKVFPSSPILVTLIMEAIRSYETSVLTRATLRHIPEDDILHSRRRENLKSYIALTGCAL
jgi:hypothetical protein